MSSIDDRMNRIAGGTLRACVWTVACAVLALLAACSVGPTAREPVVAYDFGPLPVLPAAPKPGVALQLPAVTVPVWLEGADLQYRLVYDDAARPRAYANSRWSAPPAALLTQRMQARFSAALDILTAVSVARPDYALQTELEDFSQYFAEPGKSTVSLRLRATLVHLPSRRLVAQRIFVESRPASPDAAGAAQALGVAGDALVQNLLDWTVQNLRKEGK